MQACKQYLFYFDKTALTFKEAQEDEPNLLRPFKAPRLSAKPCDLLRMRTKPVMGPFSPSCSILRLARASSPVEINISGLFSKLSINVSLTKNASGVQVSAKELAVTLQAGLGSEAVHVGASHELVQKRAK